MGQDERDRSGLLDVYRAMVTARLVDRHQADLVRRGEAFFHIPGEGHEPVAALGPHLVPADWIAAHYRDKALLLFRGVSPEAFIAATLCRGTAPGAGRQLPDIIGSRAHRVLSTPVPVGNHALHLVGVVAAEMDGRPAEPPIGVCLAGDGTSQQGEFLEAICEAVRRQLPILFVIEDNGYAISTRTSGMTIVSTPSGLAREFLGMPIAHVDGRDVVATHDSFAAIVSQVRSTGRPALIALSLDRLTSHTNADDHRRYRDSHDLAQLSARDPLQCFERALSRWYEPAALDAVRSAARAAVSAASERALAAAPPTPILDAKAPFPVTMAGRDEACWLDTGSPGTMLDAIRTVLHDRLSSDSRVMLIGQDIEDPKGDVFGVTRGLSTHFPGRVVNAALAESTIVGTAIGRAIAGQRPVALIQFADFLPLAFNQIANELATMYWRSAGEFSCPVVILAPCGGYKPGMGPFHAQTFDGTAIHVPGLDVVMPSTPADACGLLQSALDSPRPTLFLYPKAALNVTGTGRAFDVSRHRVGIGQSSVLRRGGDLTVVAWGNTVKMADGVASVLDDHGFGCDVIDLRSLSPWDEGAIVESVEKTGRLLIVHEDNLSAGLGSEIAARVAERASRFTRVLRVARPDVPIPCHFDSQLAVLPSLRSVLTAAARLLEVELTWEEVEGHGAPDIFDVPVIGSGPSDESVFVSEMTVKPGTRVSTDDVLAIVDTAKCAVEVTAPRSGVVVEISVREGDEVVVGTTLLRIRVDAPLERFSSSLRHSINAKPRLVARPNPSSSARAAATVSPVHLTAVRGAMGSRVLTHDELLSHHAGRSVDEIVRLTGIVRRQWLAPGEDATTLAVRAARRALADAALEPAEIDLVICATTTPSQVAPSTACQVAGRIGIVGAPAYDVSAACSGYLFALQAAHDFLRASGAGRVLVLTTEVLSTRTDVDDFDTAFLFGDAATATVLTTGGASGPMLHRPVLASRPDLDNALFVPLAPEGRLRMKGGRVFAEAVRALTSILGEACAASGLSMQALDAVIPHQANGRILDAVERRCGRPVVRHLSHIGNTSSSSIPLALEARLAESPSDGWLGICSFGGGFTSGAALIECSSRRKGEEPWR